MSRPLSGGLGRLAWLDRGVMGDHAGPADLRAAPGTAGRPPRGTAVTILDEDGHEVPTGRTGEIFVANEMLFAGYTDGEARQRQGVGLSTGDLGHLDADGRLFVDGRADEMIVKGDLPR